MARNTQLVEIDLRAGVITNESPLAIGPRLTAAQNVVWNYPYPISVNQGGGVYYTGPWFTRMPLMPPYVGLAAVTGAKTFFDILFGAAPPLPFMGVIGTNTSDQYSLWPFGGGAEVPFDGTASRSTLTGVTTPGCSVYWKNPGSHPRVAPRDVTTGLISMTFAATGKTITRQSGSGSFIDDGFHIGDVVTGASTSSNNTTYTITAMTALVLTVAETPVNETDSSCSLAMTTSGVVAYVYAAAGKTITRASGSFLVAGFRVGDTVTVSLSTSNDGTYKITAATALVLTVAETLIDEASGTSLITLNADLPTTTGFPTAVQVFGHRDLTKIYYMLSTDTAVFELNVDVANCPTKAAALCVYLDRLWIASNNNQKIYYTSPLDLNDIRTTNVINLDGAVPTCLVPGQFGAIDASGVPHLFIGCANRIFVLDGDPFLGGGTQADLRVLSDQIGVTNCYAAATTQYGVFFLGTDGNLWQVPAGMTECRPVGDLVRNKIGVNSTGTLDLGDAASGTLAWFDPFLYYFPCGDTQAGWIFRPSRDGIQEAWGPLKGDTRLDGVLLKSAPESNAAYTPSTLDLPSVWMLARTALQGDATRKINIAGFDNRTTASQVGRTASITTGFINTPGHRVQPTHLILETIRLPQVSSADVTWTVTATSETGTSVTAVRLPDPVPPSGVRSIGALYAQHFMFPPLVAARAFKLTITPTATADLGLVRALVEYHTTPEQF